MGNLEVILIAHVRRGDFVVVVVVVVVNPLHNDFYSNAISGILHGNVTPFWRLYGVIWGIIIVVIAVTFLSIFFTHYGFLVIIWKQN